MTKTQLAMSWMFEVYYSHQSQMPDATFEQRVVNAVGGFDGALTYREETKLNHDKSRICLTFEFQNLENAMEAAQTLRDEGAHVEGPGEY